MVVTGRSGEDFRRRLLLSISGKEVVIAAGVYMPEREQLSAIRKYLLDHHEEVRNLLNDKKLRRQMDSFDGLRLTRPPKGFPKEHPAMDLILCRQWGLAATLPAETALSQNFVREIVQRFRLVAPLGGGSEYAAGTPSSRTSGCCFR